MPNKKTQQINIRGLNHHIHLWGDSDKPMLFMLHGWMDCGASFKFIAEHLSQDFFIIAPDLRGFGDTEHAVGGYWFADYFADLSVLLNHYSPDQAVNLLGHSMGGNIALAYAGLQPERVANLLSLEGLGMVTKKDETALSRHRQWLSEVVEQEPTKIYPDKEALKASIRKGNPSLSAEMVEELLLLWGKSAGNGQMMLKHDHGHRFINPYRYQHEDMLSIWQQVTAKSGLVMAEQSSIYQYFDKIGRVQEAIDVLKIKPQDNFLVKDAHHMLHLEQPQQTSDCIRQFFINK